MWLLRNIEEMGLWLLRNIEEVGLWLLRNIKEVGLWYSLSHLLVLWDRTDQLVRPPAPVDSLEVGHSFL